MPPTLDNQSIGTMEIVRHFWRRKWLLLILPPIVLVLAYLYVRTYVGETFESTALVMVRTPPSTMRDGQALAEIEPPVYEDILISDEVTRETIEATRAKYPEEFGARRFEKQRELFTVESLMTRDTAVQATYSPVLALTVKGPSPEVTHFMAVTWLDLVLQRYGSLRQGEAAEMTATMSARYNELSESAFTLQEQEAELEQRLASLTRQLDAENEIIYGNGAAQSPGLYQERARMKATGNTELQRVEELLSASQSQVAQLAQTKVELMGQLEKVQNELSAVRAQMGGLRSILGNAAPDAAKLSDPANPEYQGDLVVLSRPVMPEMRVAPPRTLIAGVVTLAVMGLLATLILAELYLKRALVEPR